MLTNKHFWRVWFPPHLIAFLGLAYCHDDWRMWAMFFACYCLISGLGVAVGLHRYFSHKAFKTSKFWQHAMLYFGNLACQGNAVFWVALHVGLHHRFTDTDKDPHSPISHGTWHAYQGYAFDDTLASKVPLRAGANVLRHPEWLWSVNHYHKILWGTWGLVALLSLFTGPWLLAGLGLAQAWAINQEAAVNLFGHKYKFGSYRPFATIDESVNRNWLGLLTWGQALHQSHHHNPAEANFAFASGTCGHKEFDPAMLWIKAIQT